MRTTIICAAAVMSGSTSFAASLEFLTPNTGPGPISTTVGGFTFINHGLQGVGRIDASMRDQFLDTFGSVSSMQIGNWVKTGDQYSGTFYTLPDRGRNDVVVVPNVFSDYAGRIQTVPFTFTPYTGAAPLGGTTIAEKKAAQNQIVPTYQGGVQFTYQNPVAGAPTTTTGLDPGGNTSQLLGQAIPFVPSQTIGGNPVAVNKLALDAEGLILKPDGSGWVSDEYGPYVYHFNASKQIDGILGIPQAILPHSPAGALNFNSAAAPTNGRRNNQGMEGIALSPDGTRLFALLQSAAVQDSSANQATRNNTRLLVYDISSDVAPSAPVQQFAVELPVLNNLGNGSAADRTAAQSEIVALSNSHVLVLSRDSNGLGPATNEPSVFKSVMLYDTTGATDFATDTGINAEGGRITSAPGTLLDTLTPAAGAQVLNMLNEVELNKFNINLNHNNSLPKDELTFSEKWEGMSLVPALDSAAPNDYFLFVANDNDFTTTNGFMKQADGSFLQYDSDFNNDTVFLTYRVTIVPEPGLAGIAAVGAIVCAARRRR